jgi:hypothetical protein
MNTLEVLREARSILGEPGTWTKGALARYENGHPAGVHDPEATCRCLYSTLVLATARLHPSGYESPTATFEAAVAAGFKGTSDVVRWNDAPERTHAEVLAKLDTAIAWLEK